MRPSAVPRGPGQTSTPPYSSGPPSGKSGRPGSAVPARSPGLPSKWATPPQCTGQFFRHQGPQSPAPLAAVPARSGCPGSGAACPGPIPDSRNVGPGASSSCCQIRCCSFVPGGVTSRGQLAALNSTAHAPPAIFLFYFQVELQQMTPLGNTWLLPHTVSS